MTNQSILAEAGAVLSALVLRADALEGCLDGSEEEAELAVISDAIEVEVDEAIRWPEGSTGIAARDQPVGPPEGKVAGGKG